MTTHLDYVKAIHRFLLRSIFLKRKLPALPYLDRTLPIWGKRHFAGEILRSITNLFLEIPIPQPKGDTA
jgi:hypothetical protein